MATTPMANDRLKLERRRRGWTQNDVADRMQKAARKHGLTVPRGLNGLYISRWERGAVQPDYHSIHLLCLAFDLPPDRLGLPGAAPVDEVDRSKLVTVSTSSDPPYASATIVPVRRRTFVKLGAALTGTAVFDPKGLSGIVGAFSGDQASRSVLATAERPEIALLAAALAEYVPDEQSEQSGTEDGQSLTALLDDAWLTFHASRYSELVTKLPALLKRSRMATIAPGKLSLSSAHRSLTEVYQLFAIALLKFGSQHHAWIAADRATQSAERVGDPLLAASVSRILSHAIFANGHYGPSITLAVSMAERIAPTAFDTNSADALSLYGALLQKAAMASARTGDVASTHSLLESAQRAANRLGVDANHYHTVFGPTNVAVHQVEAAVELGDPEYALNSAQQVNIEHLAVTERRASHLLQVAAAQAQWNNDEAALELVRRAEAVAAEEVRAQPLTYSVLAELLRRDRRHNHELRALAMRLGLEFN
jgi:transcriptional regulator with XRE-family HTH domain